mmetsp:Transcript_21707/g.47313  ORF Transcript_21707/g.47313 Transcript_21707/m.47313 type:complete len:150 (+) Transcript_21707:67-516(+)
MVTMNEIFFAVPVLCLVAQFMLPHKTGSALIHRLFFTRGRIGNKANHHEERRLGISPIWMFIHLSLLVLVQSANKMKQSQYENFPKRLSDERMFWLSLLNVFLWFLVWKMQSLKETIISLEDRIEVLEISSELFAGRDSSWKKRAAYNS